MDETGIKAAMAASTAVMKANEDTDLAAAASFDFTAWLTSQNSKYSQTESPQAIMMREMKRDMVMPSLDSIGSDGKMILAMSSAIKVSHATTLLFS